MDAGVKVKHVDYSDAFNTSQLFATRDKVLHRARSVTHEIGFVVVIMRLDTNISVRGRVSFLLIAYERSGEYRPKKKGLVRTCTSIRKCGCPFKLCAKPVLGGEGWMMKLICGTHNHEIAKSFVGHPYASRLTKDEKIIVANMTKSMQFRGLFMKVDALLGVIVTDRDLALMNAVKTGSLVDYPCESYFDEYLMNLEMACSPWPMFVGYVCQTWVILHKEKFVKARTNKVMHLGNTTTNRLLQNSLGDICSVWEVMNNMMTLQHTQIKASFKTSTYIVGHVFKVTLYKKLLGMVSRYALNEIVTKYERVAYADITPSCCGWVRTTHGLPCACELSKYGVGSIPLKTIHIFWRRLSFLDQGLCEAEVTITEEMEMKSKRIEQLDVYGKLNLKTKLREIAYLDLNSMCPPPEKVKTKDAPKKPLTKHQKSTKYDLSYWDYIDALHSEYIENIIDVKADGNCRYRAIAALLGIGEDSWSLVRKHLHKELTSWSKEYINLLGGIEKFEELKYSLLVAGLYMVTIDKLINITDMGYVIASQYKVLVKSTTTVSYVHRVICIGHVYENHFVHRNGERKRERRRHFKEKMSLEEAHHHRRPWIRAWRKKEMNEGRGREEHEILCSK
ncbi:hypothetical protein HKD37_18G051289 [Glycine soja]